LTPSYSLIGSSSFSAALHKLHLDPVGKLGPANKVELLPTFPEYEDIVFFPQYPLFLYTSKQRRDKQVRKIERLASKATISDYCLVLVDSKLSYVQFPSAIYMAIRQVTEIEWRTITEDWETEISDIETHIQLPFGNQYHNVADSFGVSYPNVFTDHLNNLTINSIRRHGRFTPLELFSDDEILQKMKGTSDGTNPTIYSRVVSPQYRDRWDIAIAKVTQLLRENEDWRIGFEWFMAKVETEMSQVKVSINAFEPNNILLCLYKVLDTANFAYLPLLEVFAEDKRADKRKDDIRILTGFLEWDRKTAPKTLEETIPRGLRYQYGTFLLSDIYSSLQQKFMRSHGLKYAIFETTITENGEFVHKRLKILGDEVVMGDEVSHLGQNFLEFFKSNEDYLREFYAFFRGSIFEIK
jgi:hypothetical protein